MLEASQLDKYDISGMYKIYDSWPKLARESYEVDFEAVDFKEIDHIIFSGMGGSGSVCDVLASIFSKSNIHVNVTKGYEIPKTIDSHTLVISISTSGDTQETLSVLDSAAKMGSKTLSISSGGQMEQYCLKNNLMHRNIPFIHSPRASLVSFLYSMLKILSSIIPMKQSEIYESLNILDKTGILINSSNLTNSNQSYELSQWISGIPLIYYPQGLQSAAIRFKNCLQENAKSHVIIENIIEACHNGIMAWEKKSNVQPMLLRGQDDHIKTKERWKIIQEYFQENKIDYKEIYSVQGNILSKLINLIYLFDYTTIYKAVSLQLDPSPIDSIDFIKKRLN